MTDTDREAFEAWASDNGAYPQCIERLGDGYKLMATQQKWGAWQAANCITTMQAATQRQQSRIAELEADAALGRQMREAIGNESLARFIEKHGEPVPIMKRVAELEAEVQALRKDAEWRPIETAPKDHGVTQFDVWANGERYPGCFWGRATYEPGDSGIVYQSDYDWNGPVDSYVKGATHWKPLPPAPSAAMNKEGARD